MDTLLIASTLVNFLQSGEYSLFVTSLKLIGNLCASENSSYSEHFYKNQVLEALTIGWQQFHNTDVDKQVYWLITNIIASNSPEMVRAIVDNQFFMEKFRVTLEGRVYNQVQRELFYSLSYLTQGYDYSIIEQVLVSNDI